MKIDWRPNLTLSALYAAEVICSEADLVDERIRQSLQGPSIELHDWYRQKSPSGSPSLLWNTLIELAFSAESPEQIAAEAQRVLFVGSPTDLAAKHFMAGRIAEIQAAYALLFPKFSQQLDLRIRPLKELWEGWGPGLLAHVGRLTERELIVPHSTVIAVQPVLGGGGKSYPQKKFVAIEAVLTNPIPELPEVIRLAWLLAQQGESQATARQNGLSIRERSIWALAMLPPVLAASQIVELSRIDEQILDLALEEWAIAIPESLDEPARRLLNWWETYLQTKPSWEIALNAIDKMLE